MSEWNGNSSWFLKYYNFFNFLKILYSARGGIFIFCLRAKFSIIYYHVMYAYVGIFNLARGVFSKFLRKNPNIKNGSRNIYLYIDLYKLLLYFLAIKEVIYVEYEILKFEIFSNLMFRPSKTSTDPMSA